jgi:hypothetical protein
MFKAQYKRNSPYESWIVIGTFSGEQAAISAALQYKRKGMVLVRVTDKKGAVIYSN